jgi:hypothetical protein
VISGPESQQNPAKAFSHPAHVAGGSTTAASASAAGQPSGSNQQTDQLTANTGNPNAAMTQQVAVTGQCLELSIRCGPDTFVLGEIDDLTQIKMDHWVFDAIKRKYELNRVAARLFGRFAYLIPNGGIPVKVSVSRSSRSTSLLSSMSRTSSNVRYPPAPQFEFDRLILELSSGKTKSQPPTVTRPLSASWLAHVGNFTMFRFSTATESLRRAGASRSWRIGTG